MLSVPKNSQGAPNCDRTVQLFDALPPRCHRIETHLQKKIYVLLFALTCWSVTYFSYLQCKPTADDIWYKILGLSQSTLQVQ
jgi:hypothetical protein